MKRSMSKKPVLNTRLRLPKDYPWKVLQAVFEDHSYCLQPADAKLISHIIRTRDIDSYLKLTETWDLQCKNPSERKAPEFRALYQIASLIKKFRFPSDNSARKAAAISKFIAAEAKCKSYNSQEYMTLRSLPWKTNEIKAFTYARDFLIRLLGVELPSQEELTLWSRHGPGANLDTKERHTSLYDKYSEWPYSCTEDCIGHARSVILSDERWFQALELDYKEKNNIPFVQILDINAFWDAVLTVVPGNRITFVPKNSQTDRSIAIEPSLNLYLQLGVDGFIRRRLKRWGVNLDSQLKNQRLALEGSRDYLGVNPFVTIDLAAASDSISLKVCESLLPTAWMNYLLDLRSPCGILEGEVIFYEKISSMGNGFTFALESAIFTALAYGVIKAETGSFSRDEFAVYGDDIIVRQAQFPLMNRMLELCGFSMNLDKSFVEGPFRESCGADYFQGTPVRPVFLEQDPISVMQLWNDYNRLYCMLDLRSLAWGSRTLQILYRWIPQDMRCYTGPLSVTEFDTYIHTPTPERAYRRGFWKFHRVVVSYRPTDRGVNFYFRKLMNPLRQTSEPAYISRYELRTWAKAGVKVVSSGSSFDVVDLTAVDVGVSPSWVSIWPGEYSELLPVS